MRRVVAAMVLGIALSSVAHAQESARVVTVSPASTGDLVVCRLTTAGLPGEKLLQSMRSGLVSAVDLDLVLLDENEQVVGGNHISLQLGFDLWEEIFSVRADGSERRFHNLADLESYLEELDGLPVAPLNRLVAGERYRLRVGLEVYPIAPAARDRIEDVIAGEQRPRREGQDQQQAQVSLGRLIRLFYKGSGDGRSEQQMVSAWFTRRELAHAQD